MIKYLIIRKNVHRLTGRVDILKKLIITLFFSILAGVILISCNVIPTSTKTPIAPPSTALATMPLTAQTGISTTNIPQSQLLPTETPKTTNLSKLINIKDFGAVGDGIVDDTETIQNAIDYASLSIGSIVYVPAGIYMINAIDQVNLKSNINLVLDKEAILRAIPNDSTHYAVLSLNQVSNITISGGIVEGERDFHSGIMDSKSQWGHCIVIKDSSRIIIRDVTIRYAWGDGIYIGHSKLGAGNKNIYISNVISEFNRRQGLSLIEGENILISDSVFRNITGQNPQAGIDIEPNNVDQMIYNIVLRNIETAWNGNYGIALGGDSLNEFYITIVNHTDIGSINPYYIAPLSRRFGPGILIYNGNTIILNGNTISGSYPPVPLCNLDFICDSREDINNCPIDCDTSFVNDMLNN